MIRQRTATKVIEANPRFPMGYAWSIVAESGRRDHAQVELRLRQLGNIMPGFTIEDLPIFQLLSVRNSHPCARAREEPCAVGRAISEIVELEPPKISSHIDELTRFGPFI